MKRFTLGFSVALAVLSGPVLAAAPAIETAAQDDMENVKKWVEGTFAPFVHGHKALLEEVTAANKDRAAWTPFTEDYKKWTPEDAEKNKPGYAYSEFLWSVKKDKDFRAKHTSPAVVTALKEFQDSSGGVVSEFFVTDAKGGNVVQTQLTSDWFQGDEPKFTDCAEKGVIAYGKPKRDETTGETGVHASVPLFDSDKKLIGVAVVLVIVEKVK